MAGKGDLVIILRKEYERLLGLSKRIKTPIKEIKQVIPEDQKWFYTKEWQEGEREADEDIKAGRVSGPFTNAKDLIKHLNGLK